MIGKILGKRYQITEKIDTGGMSTVYKALDFNLKRYDAVKILKEEYSSNPEFVEKFRQEANSVAGLNHPNIVSIYNVGSEGNLQYIVMEFVRGRTLKKIINEKGRLFQDQVINYSEQIGRGLQHAHLNGIIHRDIKPQNIMITDDDRVKVTDFGIAKSSESSTITNSGRIIGSVHYFSPEQARGLLTDRRSDIYSLGIVMYEMATGRLPFDSESPVTIALKHMQEPIIPPKTINPQISDKLNSVILKATQKDPLDRYQSMDEMVTDIQKIKSGDSLIYAVSQNIPEDTGRTQVMAPVRTQSPVKRRPQNEKNYSRDEYEYDEEDLESMEKSEFRKGRMLLLSMLLLLVLLSGVVMLSYRYFKNSAEERRLQEMTVTLPKLIGVNVDRAKADLSAMELNVNVIEKKDSDQPGGTVIETSPQAGTPVKKGSTVNVTISSLLSQVEIPDLHGLTPEEGKKVLESQGMTAGKLIPTESAVVEEGRLSGTIPEAGKTVNQGSTVDLLVAIPKKEPLEIEMPDLSGLDQAKAEELLKKSNLKRGTITYIATPDKKEDKKLLGQSPSPGETVTEGTVIDIKIGKFSKDATVIANNPVTGTHEERVPETTRQEEETKPEEPSGNFDVSQIAGRSFNEVASMAAAAGYSIDIMNLHLPDGSRVPPDQVAGMINSGTVDATVTEGYINGSTLIVNCQAN